jgi:hypothetical protein
MVYANDIPSLYIVYRTTIAENDTCKCKNRSLS